MSAVDDLWVPTTHTDRYHGEVRAPDGRRWWAVRHLNRSAGWCVALHDGSSDGPVIARQWHPTFWAAGEAVDQLRRAIALEGIGHVETCDLEAPTDRGIIVAHGVRHSRSGPSRVQLEEGNGLYVCATIWLPEGIHRLRWGSQAGIYRRWNEVEVAARRAIHVYPSALSFFGRPPVTPPWYHRCAHRRIHFSGNEVPASALLRTDGTPRG